jgi:hypothetical protein
MHRRTFLALPAAGCLTALAQSRDKSRDAAASDPLRELWDSPPRTFRPHTRWWWPGNAATKEGITWELEQMRSQGMGGVEIMSCWNMYREGNVDYLSPQWLALIKHAILEAKRLEMEVALTLGPGWSFGGPWVPVADRSKVLAPAWVDLNGPAVFDSELPAYTIPPGRSAGPENQEVPKWQAPDADLAIAVVAARLDGNALDGNTLTDLTNRAANNRLKWEVPAGRWRIMAFRLTYTGQQNQSQNYDPAPWVIDHFSRGALGRYLDYIGKPLRQAFGDEYGRTVDSFFCDSFEIHPLPNTLLWSNDTLSSFRKRKGYALAKYLPAIWWDIGEETPYVRYDINEFLHQEALDIFFGMFISWSGGQKVQARIQPHYRFTEELIQGAGVTPRPETEVCTARFETVADPRKATAAGAHFYGRAVVSAEAYTFLHNDRYRTTLEEMKIASDAYFRDGVTQLYNHGYMYTPEKQVSPAKDMPWANRISHVNPWWRYYGEFAAYVSRCCAILRQGQSTCDVLIYSPQATVWSRRALFGSDRRVMPYGNLGKTLVASGYDYDPVNDDVLQNQARIEGDAIIVRDLRYRFLVLPRIETIPVQTYDFARRFALAGGIVVALDCLPSRSTGMADRQRNDARVRAISSEVFAAGKPGVFLPEYKIDDTELSPGEKPWSPTPPFKDGQQKFIAALRSKLAPDFALEANRVSDGLTFIHRRQGERNIYFVTNLQPAASDTPVTFRVSGKVPEFWDARTGAVSPCHVWNEEKNGVRIPLRLAAWESIFVVFHPGDRAHVTQTNCDRLVEASASRVRAAVTKAGGYSVELKSATATRIATARNIAAAPAAWTVPGPWSAWTTDAETKFFSGTREYKTTFDLPAEYAEPDIQLMLDLGQVGSVSEVFCNDKRVGVAWMQPYRLDVTGHLHVGSNNLRVLVTNTPQNYIAGLKDPGEVPEKYAQGATLWRNRDRKIAPPMSGMPGPVRISASRIITMEFA